MTKTSKYIPKDCEEGIAGAILYSSHNYHAVSQLLTEDSFALEGPRCVWRIATQLMLRNQLPTDERAARSIILDKMRQVSISEYYGKKRAPLSMDEHLDPSDSMYAKCYGLDTLAEHTRDVSPAVIQIYAQQIKEATVKRAMYGSINRASMQLDTSDPVELAGQIAVDYQQARRQESNVISAADATDEAVEVIGRWGVSSMDDLAPIMAGAVIVVGAKPGGGKTSLAIQAAIHTAAGGDTVYIFSMEQRPGQVSTMVKKHNMPGVESVLINDGMQSYEQICSTIYAESAQGVRMFIIDYAQLVRCLPGKNKYETLSEGMIMLSQTAKHTGSAVLLLSQISRGSRGGKDGVDDEPTGADFKGAGEIEESATICVALWKSSKDREGCSIISGKTTKNRYGQLARTDMFFIGDEKRFTLSKPFPKTPAKPHDKKYEEPDDSENLFG